MYGIVRAHFLIKWILSVDHCEFRIANLWGVHCSLSINGKKSGGGYTVCSLNIEGEKSGGGGGGGVHCLFPQYQWEKEWGGGTLLFPQYRGGKEWGGYTIFPLIQQQRLSSSKNSHLPVTFLSIWTERQFLLPNCDCLVRLGTCCLLELSSVSSLDLRSSLCLPVSCGICNSCCLFWSSCFWICLRLGFCRCTVLFGSFFSSCFSYFL